MTSRPRLWATRLRTIKSLSLIHISETTYKPDDGTEVPDTITYISHAKLELEEPGAEYVYMMFKVPYTPMDAIGAGDASGDGMSARIFLDWDEAEKTTDSSVDPDTSTSKGKDDSGKDIEDVVLTDQDTGIILDTTTERVSADVDLKVEALTEGSRYDIAAKALGDAVADYKVSVSYTHLRDHL